MRACKVSIAGKSLYDRGWTAHQSPNAAGARMGCVVGESMGPPHAPSSPGPPHLAEQWPVQQDLQLLRLLLSPPRIDRLLVSLLAAAWEAAGRQWLAPWGWLKSPGGWLSAAPLEPCC